MNKNMKKVQRISPKRSYAPHLKYTTARPQLVIDFNNRCGYCDDSAELACCSYHIDHFVPRRFTHLLDDYSNFVYACPYCNISKKDKWISDSSDVNIIEDKGFVDPCEPSYNDLFERTSDGKIVPLSKLGAYIHSELKLYLKRHEILYLLEEIDIKCDLIEKKIEEYSLKGKKTEKLEKIHFELLKYFRDYHKIYRKSWNAK